MRFRFPFLLILLFLSATSFAESMDDLVKRKGLYYKKFTDVPFTGEIDQGWEQGSIKNGRRVGTWRLYYSDGGLWYRGAYDEKTQWRDGLWVGYWSNGQLWMKGEYRNGMGEGYWEVYHQDGSVNRGMTGTYKNGQKISD